MTRFGVTGHDPPTVAEEFGRALRLLRDRSQRTQQEIADSLGVKRATLSQWETGRHLPSTENAAQLDHLLDAGGELRDRISAARSSADEPEAGSTTTRAQHRPSLRDVYDRMGRALVDRLEHDGDGAPIGWHHDLTADGGAPRPQSTAFGIRLLQLLDGPHVDLNKVGRTLLDHEDAEGGWRTSTFGPRPEATAAVLDALSRLGTEVRLDAHLARLEELMDVPSRRRVFVVSAVLQTVARLRPESDFATELVHDLMALRRTASVTPLWPEKTPNEVRERAGLVPAPSVAHTARAVVALAPFRDDPEVGDAVDEALAWLAGVDPSNLSRENLAPVVDDERRDLEVRHFTPALVARALSLAHDPQWDRVQHALDAVWSHYRRELGLWSWPNLDTPVWLQLDAIAAVRLAAEHHAVPALPVPAAHPEP